MTIVEIILIAIGLSMDAFAVSVSKGLSFGCFKFKKALLIGLYFGFFQFLMPVIGWFFGSQLNDYLVKFGYVIAFIMLFIIGLKMILEAKSDEDNISETACNISHKELFVLAVATSIDALAVGFSFALLNYPIISSSLIIGFITFIFSIIGVKTGCIFGKKYKTKSEIIGGIILILIGIKILLEHFI